MSEITLCDLCEKGKRLLGQIVKDCEDCKALKDTKSHFLGLNGNKGLPFIELLKLNIKFYEDYVEL